MGEFYLSKKLIKYWWLFGIFILVINYSMAFSNSDKLDESKLPIIVHAILKDRGSQIFEYQITNLSEQNLYLFKLGESGQNKFAMDIFKENIPQSIESPKGWKGEVNFIEGGIHLNLLWTASDLGAQIKPKQKLDGFFVDMLDERDTSKYVLVGPGDRLIKPLDMMSIPFKVCFYNGKCVWGIAKSK